MNVFQRLNDAREKFHALKLEKTGHNKFAGYNYFELGDFLIPALRVFKAAGLCAVVSFEKEVATMLIVNTDEGDTLTIQSPMGSAALKGCHEVQNIGAVETYQRRYLWVAALEIVEHDALDATTGSANAQEPAKTAPQTRERAGVAQDVLSTSPPLSADRQASLKKLAENVKEDFAAYGAQAAYERIDEQGLEDLEKIFLSTLLPSNVRNPITAYSRSIHSTKETA